MVSMVSNSTHTLVQGHQGVQQVQILCGGRQYRAEKSRHMSNLGDNFYDDSWFHDLEFCQ